ncbi:MAG: hypothetical protein NT084_07325 [Bacteroidetes bacterium]|jgi:hypothetical protein|nr:hypothetical protein [Bacteroidota bacterium]
MKHVILIIGLIFSFVTLEAQVKDTPADLRSTYPQTAHKQAVTMQKALSLSDAQTVKVESVLLSRLESNAAINLDATKAADVKQKEIQAVNDSKEKELAGILTAEQFALYLHKKQEAKASHQSAH